MTEIRYAHLRLEDAEGVADLARRVWHAHFPGIISTAQIDYMLAQRYKPGLIRQTMARGDHWDLAWAGEELVGYSHGYPMGEGDYKLDKLYVTPDLQRHGIGAGLFERHIAHARAAGCDRLVLRVNRHNEQAISAYQKYGFSIATPLVEEIGGGFVMDDYVMIYSADSPRPGLPQ